MAVLSKSLQQIDRTFVLDRGRKLIYFGGCDYYRLASDPRVLRAVEEGLKQFGLNVAASRTTTGNHALYEKLEHELARFFMTEAAVLFSSGYLTNQAVAQSMAGEFSHVLLDERAHGSLCDASVAFQCPVIRFRHRSVADVASAVGRLGTSSRPILLTDGMFAADGAIAPVNDYLNVLPENAMMLLDDAHGAGVMGKQGRGIADAFGLHDFRIIRTTTLSKAFGVYGGVVLCNRELGKQIVESSHAFTGSTPLPLPLVCGALESVEILSSDLSLRRALMENIRFVKTRLQVHSVEETPCPIIVINPNDPEATEDLANRLLAAGIHPPFIRYPGGAESGFFRFAISSAHTREQLESLVMVLRG